MARKRMTKDHRRVQLMDAAARLFAKSSYGQVTTAELAKTAGVTEPVIYQHFKTKLDLYIAVLRRAREMTLERYALLEASMPTPLLRLIAVVRAHGEIMRDNEPYFRLHLRSLATSEMPRIKQVLRENYLSYNKYFADLIRKAQAQGEVHKAVDAEETAWFIMSQGVMMNLCNQLGINELQDSGYVDRLLEDALAHIALVEAPLQLLKKLRATNGKS